MLSSRSPRCGFFALRAAALLIRIEVRGFFFFYQPKEYVQYEKNLKCGSPSVVAWYIFVQKPVVVIIKI